MAGQPLRPRDLEAKQQEAQNALTLALVLSGFNDEGAEPMAAQLRALYARHHNADTLDHDRLVSVAGALATATDAFAECARMTHALAGAFRELDRLDDAAKSDQATATYRDLALAAEKARDLYGQRLGVASLGPPDLPPAP